METLASRKLVFQVKASEHVDCNESGSVTCLFPAAVVLLCRHRALYCNLHYRQCKRDVHGDRVPVSVLPVRGPLPVPGNIHYRHPWDFSYSPLELFIYCGHNVTFVLPKKKKKERKRGESDSTPVNRSKRDKAEQKLLLSELI